MKKKMAAWNMKRKGWIMCYELGRTVFIRTWELNALPGIERNILTGFCDSSLIWDADQNTKNVRIIVYNREYQT